ncbi:BMP family lipoprotein [Kibdelosporangium phytohabitans]|uniref:ABC transporter substrate-binding protein PnrA-like domain-containing protein n=1 Tax=Kibdelosporangium phytohabitans TaxID=860235 RepID=A0A0N7F559_9PSEU|nr:BMP family ABC transporter substrate-binding protein [Kibdelosporangium phytohabitans]ALG13319.1 hypothetical protein AOZ06_46445 [Kibdelosporangium phytohabitans]MBE1465102.1 basic membrane protein A [Kibdelosporangium phytohabitans]
MKTRIAAAYVCLVLVLASCSATPDSRPDRPGALRVAIVLAGLANDSGFHQIGADGVRKFQQDGEIELQIRESVINPVDAEPVFRQYAAEGYDLVIGWGFSYADAIFRTAKEFPDAHFLTTGGADVAQKATANVATWTYAAEEMGFLLGYIAGQSKLSPVAVVEGEKQPFVQAQWFGFSQGLRLANPAAAEMPPIYTGSFEDAEKANQATATRIREGARLIAANAEGYAPGVASAAKTAGVATVGLASTTSEAAREVNIGRVRVDLVPLMRGVLDRLKSKSFAGQALKSTLANRSLVPSDINKVATAPDVPGDLDSRVDDLVSRLAAGKLAVEPWTPGR